MSSGDKDWKRLGSGELTAQDADEGLGHVLPIRTYGITFSALLLLTIITVAAAQVDFGQANVLIAILIASIKAGLVMSIFMHLKFEGKLILLYALYPFIVLFLLIGGSFLDDLERPEIVPANVAAGASDAQTSSTKPTQH